MLNSDLFIDTWGKSYTEEVRLSAAEESIREALQKHVGRLASEIGERNHSRLDALEKGCRITASFLAREASNILFV